MLMHHCLSKDTLFSTVVRQHVYKGRRNHGRYVYNLRRNHRRYDYGYSAKYNGFKISHGRFSYKGSGKKLIQV